MRHLIEGNPVTPWAVTFHACQILGGSNMSAHVLLNLLNKLGKRDKM